jgi:hypothetical protein
MSKVYAYVIDMDERGEFASHVLDKDDNIIYQMHKDDETGELWLVRDGFIRDGLDIKGLEKYLRDMKVLEKDSILLPLRDAIASGHWD